MKELQFKEWVRTEAQKRKVQPHTIHGWFYAGRYKGIKLRKVNKRVIFVQLPAPEPREPPDGAVRLKEWLYAEAERCGTTAHAICARLHRGKYPNVERLAIGTTRANYVRVKV